MFVTICVFFYSSVSWILYVCLKISKLKYLQLSSSNKVSHKLDIWYYSVPFGRHLKKSTGSGFSEHALCLSVVTHRLGSCSHTSHWPLVSVSKQWLHVFLSVTLKEHYITFFDNLKVNVRIFNFIIYYILPVSDRTLLEFEFDTNERRRTISGKICIRAKALIIGVYWNRKITNM